MVAIGGSAGRGRSVRQKMFTTTRLYRSGIPGIRLSTIAQNYFWGPTPPTPVSTNQNWPWTVTQVAFQSDPFDTNAITLYNDISIRMQSLNTARGRQYELDQISAGESSLTAYDPDEALNPTNPSSPYYPGVKIYRRVLDQAMWPPTPAQVTTVPFNSNSTFEAGISPWTGTNNATVTQSTTASHSGVSSLLITPDQVTNQPGAISEMMRAYPNVSYTLNGWLMSQGAAAGRTLEIDWYDASGALISASSIFPFLGTPGVWFNANQTFLSPSNTASMQIKTLAGTTVIPAWFLDDVTVTPASGVNLINLAGGGYLTGYDFGNDPTFEIYPVGTFLSFFEPFGGAGNVNVQSAVPFTGTRYLECVLNAGNGSPQGIGITLICIPGVTYTFSCWAMIDAGTTTVQLRINNGPIGSSAIPAGSYVRMSVTFTATLNLHTALLQTLGTITSAKLRMDSVQLEMGPVATAFTTYGPTVFGVFSGFIERYPASWTYSGTYGMSALTCVDALAILANQSIYGEIRNEILFQAPAYYWPLDDGQGATFFGEKSGNAGTELTIVNATNGAGTITPGTSVKITGDPGGTAVQITNGVVGSNTKGSTLQTATNNLVLGGSGATWGITAIINVILPASVAGPIFMVADALNKYFLSIELDGSATPGVIGKLITPLGTFTTNNVNTALVADELALFITLSISGGNTTITVQDPFDSINNTFTGSNASVWGSNPPPAINFSSLYLGGRLNPYTQVIGPQCTYSHVAVWNRVLTNSQILFLFNCASNGVSHESPGARILRYVGYANLPGGTFLDNGVSDMAAAAVGGTGDTSILDAIQGVAISDNGTFYIDENGIANFQSRDTRYLTMTPAWVFGENVAAGEIPYTEDISFDYDSTQVYNDIKCSRVTGVTVFNANGITAVGGTASTIAVSRRRYGTKSLSRDLNIQSDLETQDAANWLFAAHKDPMQRIAQLVIEPSSNPASWNAALGIRIGDRVTVRRRTRQYSAFNQIGNFTMSADYFIERIEHAREPGKWRVTYQMSPAGAVAGLQPWILENATYGILDQTTLLGY